MEQKYSNIVFSPGRVTLYDFAKEQEAWEKAELARQRRESERLAKEKTLQPVVLAEFYRYRRIQDVYGSRLLVLNSGHKEDRLTGRLEGFSVGRTRGYKALSYVWGEPQFTDVIFIDGKRLAITDGLGTALRRIRPSAGQPPLRIWIDQICINQKDTVERNQQVSLMHAIFRDAGQVLVWLGADSEGHASRAFQLAGSLRSIFDDKLLARLCKLKGSSFDWIPPEYWKSLRELCKLPWFRRVWIPQEIGTDADAIVHWGSESMRWAVLHDSMRKLETQGWELKKKQRIDTTAITLLFRRFANPPPNEMASKARLSFVYQLCLSARNVATDPRDYVFAQLGHASAWIESERAMIIQPDYDNTVATVYHEIAIRALTVDNTLMLLNAISDNGEPRPPLSQGQTLPTWVPRWDAGRFGSVIGYPGRYKASGSRKSEITKSSFEDDHRTLVVRGVAIDKIDKFTTKFTSSCFNPDSSKKELIQTAWRLCREARPTQPSRNRDSSRDAKFTTQGAYPPDPSTPALKAFLDTLAPAACLAHLSLSSSPPPTSPPPSSAAAYHENYHYHSGIAALGKLFAAWSSHFSIKHDPRKLLPPPPAAAEAEALETEPGDTAPEKRLNPTAWMQAAEDHAVNRRFAVTKEASYFAMVPPTAKAGDILCVLLGGETPYVLRADPADGERYLFVGEAYVPGLMGNEKGVIGAGLEVKTFRIR
ncbi:Heterokaryon incompatibility protein 6, OR allele [Madurella mycetomatis]|uniref:Heterokaryon incompatibility protein 6, OR allele n=1 Tax=Madurella mycetomatis TaxID=100816 RepID=A0A175WAK2_9PEZI|nr:Heterokaryon incompatibility protein 6, OR allele [Madurella mycetomatis]